MKPADDRSRGSVSGPVPDDAEESFALGRALQAGFEKRLAGWAEADYLRRFWAKDPKLWVPEPVPEITDRMGWLELSEASDKRLADILDFADTVKAAGFTHAVLLGMGGSSLAADVFRRTFDSAPGHPQLAVLDSTHPAAVAAVEARVDLPRTLFVVSSKSGTTIEPLSFFRYFWNKVGRVTDSPGRHFIAVTDAGTPLQELARDRKFLRVFEARSDVGGRYSALTDFGLVPAAIMGLDIRRILGRAGAAARANGPEAAADKAPGLRLGAAIGEAADTRDKLTMLTSPALEAFPDWLEQLIAESTGKDGRGIIPVAAEPPVGPEKYGRDRLFVSFVLDGDQSGEVEALTKGLEGAGHPVVRIRLAGLYALGREIFDWEMAIPAAGSVIGIHPFNQPDVEIAKDLARKAMDASSGEASGPRAAEEAVAIDDEGLRGAFGSWLSGARAGDYIAVQAYLAPDAKTTDALQELRRGLLEKTGLATTLGYGPRFLHSTGQLHKGGPNEVLALQLVDEPRQDFEVPETDFTFGSLIGAQALGDYQALRKRGRRVLRINLKKEAGPGIGRLRALIED